MSAHYERRTNHRRLIDYGKVKETLNKNKLLWVAPTIVFTIIGTIHALTKNDVWKASQALVVRDEAIGEMGFGTRQPLGRFDNNDVLKRSLETILQISKNRKVASAALKEVRPEQKTKRFPTEEDVESFIDDISVDAPKGTEFGTSEVVYLSVEADNPERAIALADAVCTQIESRMQMLRNEHAESIIAELREKKNLAERELDTETAELSVLEGQIGSDLGEMRTLAETGSAGDSNIRSQLNQIKVELRQTETTKETQIEFLKLLAMINGETDAILGTPNRLLESQPALQRLKDGLIDAQLRAARLRAAFTDDHPKVLAAELNQQNLLSQLEIEINNAYNSTRSDLVVSQRLASSLKKKLADVQSRLDNLAAQRAGYVNLTSKVQQRREQLRQASVALAEARGRQEAARASSLINRMDSPVTGSRPIGPGRLVIVITSGIGGAFLGLSLVYLIAPWQANRAGRRKTDNLRRRAADSADLTDRRSTEGREQVAIQALTGETNNVLTGGSTLRVSSLSHLTQIVESR